MYDRSTDFPMDYRIAKMGQVYDGLTRTQRYELRHPQKRKIQKQIANKKFRSKYPEMIVWDGMKKRCRNPKEHSYNRYGGRGIEVKYKSFKEFIQDVGRRPKGYYIDRIDNNSHYEKGNCRWVTVNESNANRSITIFRNRMGRFARPPKW